MSSKYMQPVQFTEDSNKLVKTHHDVPLEIGNTYTCVISKDGNPIKYEVKLKNIEFKQKRFFSVTVDLKSSDEHKNDVYFYDPNRLSERVRRLPLHRSTRKNNEEFWETLRESDLSKQDTAIAYLADAVKLTNRKKPGKECMKTIKRKEQSELFKKLDDLKNNFKSLPVTVALPNDDYTSVTVYKIQKNLPMEKMFRFQVGDKVSTSYNDYNESKVEVVVERITKTAIVVRGPVKKDGGESLQRIPYAKTSLPFWKYLTTDVADAGGQGRQRYRCANKTRSLSDRRSNARHSSKRKLTN